MPSFLLHDQTRALEPLRKAIGVREVTLKDAVFVPYFDSDCKSIIDTAFRPRSGKPHKFEFAVDSHLKAILEAMTGCGDSGLRGATSPAGAASQFVWQILSTWPAVGLRQVNSSGFRERIEIFKRPGPRGRFATAAVLIRPATGRPNMTDPVKTLIYHFTTVHVAPL